MLIKIKPVLQLFFAALTRPVATVLLLAAVSNFPAQSALLVFSNSDIMATTSSLHPNSAAAAASFDAAVALLGGSSLVDFELAPLGSFNNLTVATGVTIAGTDRNSANHTIRNTTGFPPAPTLDGYNTTSGGANFVEMVGGTLTFTFATPVQAFGAYFSGIQTAFFADVITFSDGGSQTLLIPGAGTTNSIGALAFLGFTDVGRSISSITITASNANGADAIGVDDVRFQAASTTPEPSSFGLVLGGLFAAVGYRRRGLSRSGTGL